MSSSEIQHFLSRACFLLQCVQESLSVINFCFLYIIMDKAVFLVKMIGTAPLPSFQRLRERKNACYSNDKLFSILKLARRTAYAFCCVL